MKSIKSMVVVVVILLTLCGVWLVPSMADDDDDDNKGGISSKVEMLEEIVAELSLTVEELTERVEELEEGSGGSCSCSILNLQPLPVFPINPSEGDLCITEVVENVSGPGEPFIVVHFLWCYYAEDWQTILSYTPE